MHIASSNCANVDAGDTNAAFAQADAPIGSGCATLIVVTGTYTLKLYDLHISPTFPTNVILI